MSKCWKHTNIPDCDYVNGICPIEAKEQTEIERKREAIRRVLHDYSWHSRNNVDEYIDMILKMCNGETPAG